ncbi:hypothetical protein ACJW31_11G113500 [Castanea mollissima]
MGYQWQFHNSLAQTSPTTSVSSHPYVASMSLFAFTLYFSLLHFLTPLYSHFFFFSNLSLLICGGVSMVELGIDVWRFGGGVELMARVESVAGVSVVGLVYGSVSTGVGLVYGFGSWPWVSDWVSSCGFSVGMDCGQIWFAI